MRTTKRPIPDQARLLEQFGDGRRRPALRRGGRGQIDATCMLPSLERLLRIDRAAELAVSRTTIDGDARAAAGSTAEPSNDSGRQERR